MEQILDMAYDDPAMMRFRTEKENERKALRDQFAIAALPVVFERYGAQQFDFQLQAARAYAIADAMMKEREAK